jgi:hypothetical protein
MPEAWEPIPLDFRSPAPYRGTGQWRNHRWPARQDLCRCLFANLNTRIGCRKAPGCERIRVLECPAPTAVVGQKMDERIVSGRYDAASTDAPLARSPAYHDTAPRLR